MWPATDLRAIDEVNQMRRLGRRTGWLGWVVAGVLLVSAGGAALAAQGATTTTQSPRASTDKARAGALGRGVGWRHALGRRVLHGGVETSFGIDGDTRFGFRNEPAPSAELKVGEDAFVAGEKSGDRAVAKRVVSGDLARRGANAAGAGKATP